MNRLHQVILIASTILASWLGMQMVHESGHVLGALATGGQVAKVVLHPLTISRTDLSENPKALIVVWAGPVVGVVLPIGFWAVAAASRIPEAFVLRFFAGFCLIANGAYIAGGSFHRIGDCGEMLKYGSAMWHLWIFGAVTIPAGLWLWHRQGPRFGLGEAQGKVHRRATYVVVGICVLLLITEFLVGGE